MMEGCHKKLNSHGEWGLEVARSPVLQKGRLHLLWVCIGVVCVCVYRGEVVDEGGGREGETSVLLIWDFNCRCPVTDRD